MSLLHDAVKKASQTKQVAPPIERSAAAPSAEPRPERSAVASARPVPAATRPPLAIAVVILCVAMGTAAVAYRQNAQSNTMNALDIRLTTLSSEIARLRAEQSDTNGRLFDVQKGSESTLSSLEELSRTVEQLSVRTQETASTGRATQTRLDRLEQALSAARSRLADVEGRLVTSVPAPSLFAPVADTPETASAAA